MNDIYSIIKSPVITEKSANQGMTANKVVFWVELKANKYQIKDAVEKVFGVNVVDVNTQRVPSKVKRLGRHAGRTSIRKKAYITLKEGDSIEELVSGGATK